MPDSFQFLALAVMALGLGGVLAALLGHVVKGAAASPTLWGAFELRSGREDSSVG